MLNLFNLHNGNGTKIGSVTSQPHPSRQKALPHSEFSLFALKQLKIKKKKVIVYCCYDDLATPHESSTAYFGAACY